MKNISPQQGNTLHPNAIHVCVSQVPLPSPTELPGTESPDAPPLSRHYMKVSTEACSRCHRGGKCPGEGLCPTLGVVPVETDVFLVDEPRLRVRTYSSCAVSRETTCTRSMWGTLCCAVRRLQRSKLQKYCCRC